MSVCVWEGGVLTGPWAGHHCPTNFQGAAWLCAAGLSHAARGGRGRGGGSGAAWRGARLACSGARSGAGRSPDVIAQVVLPHDLGKDRWWSAGWRALQCGVPPKPTAGGRARARGVCRRLRYGSDPLPAAAPDQTPHARVTFVTLPFFVFFTKVFCFSMALVLRDLAHAARIMSN